MEKQKNLYQITSTLLLAFILLAGTGLFFWKAGFFEQREITPTCSKEYINLCTTENLCKGIKLYWWDNSCHPNEKLEPEPLICSKEYIHLCDTENLCKEIELYWWDNSCHTNEKPGPEPSEYPDYNSITDMNKIVLVENFRSYTPEAQEPKENDPNVSRGSILKNGKIIKGYIEIIASIDDKPLTNWESIYFKAPCNVKDHYKYGGHIFRPESLKLPQSEKTHLLFPLNNIPFLPSIPYTEFPEPKRLERFNLFEIINEKEELKFLAFISSLTPAKIDMIKIYYECDENVNNGECELTLKK